MWPAAGLGVALAVAGSGAGADVRPAYIVVDAENGAVLSHRSAARPWFPASITKVMTAYVAFRAMEAGDISPNTPVRMSQNALNQAPSKMGFAVGTVMTVDNALKMMVVKSANDIAVALAETVSGSEEAFIERMNEEAARLGMNSTQFRNPNGLPDEEQWSSARDLAVLARAAWNDYPQHRHYFEIAGIRHGKRLLRSHNTLLDAFEGANGMKTGFICSSGYNMVATATREGRTVVAVVLGSQSAIERADLAGSLIDSGFERWLDIGGRPDLDRFRARRAAGAPTDLRDQICSASARQARASARNAHGPRGPITDPVVRVFTGGANVAAANVPVPRLRPERETEIAEEDAAVEEADTEIGDAEAAVEEAEALVEADTVADTEAGDAEAGDVEKETDADEDTAAAAAALAGEDADADTSVQ